MLTKKLGYELEYIDPPILIHKKELLPFQLGTDETESEQRWNDLVSKNVNRCWWDYHDGIYEHFQEAYDYLVDYIRKNGPCLLYTSPSPRDLSTSRMPSSA